MAQLKVLRALQEDLTDRTRAFAKKHPDTNKLSALARDELRRLQQEQQELTKLFNDLTAPEGDEGLEKPGQDSRPGQPGKTDGKPKGTGKKGTARVRP
jgi:hypothetical protein